MFYRKLTTKIQSLANEYPIITLLGPRQSGKTTLVKVAFSNKPYINLEAPDVRELALTDPRGFLNRYPEGAILDEVQNVPTLLSFIQVIVDEKKMKGMFILTGSHQLELHHTIAQSLAGRTALLTLLPLSLDELKNYHISTSVDELILQGGYPRIHADHLNPFEAYKNYFMTYVERDVRKLVNVKDLMQFERFIKILAGRIGREVNMEEIGGEIGISSHTVKEWISVLEASFVIIRLQPYFENFGKRLIKSPKIYFIDVGLASYLLGIENQMQLSRDPLRGHLFENLVVLELIKGRFNQGKDHQLYFYRDVQKHEVDILFKQGHLLIPIEIKSSSTFNMEFVKNINYFQKMTSERAPYGFLIYSGAIEQSIGTIHLVNYLNAINCIESA